MVTKQRPNGGRAPVHGYRGEAETAEAPFPRTLTIAVSRETGARGGTIARHVGRKLGWQVVDQELIEYLAQEGKAGDDLNAAARRWAEDRLAELLKSGALSDDPSVISMARAVMSLAAAGEVILLGRGAGHILPPESTLHVRIVAPEADRVAYYSQWLRLPADAAADQVRLCDTRRTKLLSRQLKVDPADPNAYDLVLNSSLLGEELCAELIAQAARGKMGAERGE